MEAERIRALCYCGAEFVEMQFSHVDISLHPLYPLVRGFKCTKQRLHIYYYCKFPGCNHKFQILESERDVGSFIFHILQEHHKLNVGKRANIMLAGADFVTNNAAIQGKLSIFVDTTHILEEIPQFLGLTCEISFSQLIKDLFADSTEYTKYIHGGYRIERDTEDFDILINALRNLNYSCALCPDNANEGYYDQFPPLEVYLSHINAVHIMQTHQTENSPC